jgi:phosphomevalonate kinase
VIASAPGKLIVCGEYVVLDAAPAVCAALDRRAVVKVEAADGDSHVVTAPGYTTVAGVFRADSSRLTWSEGASDYALFEQVWRRSLPVPDGPRHFVLDTRSFHGATGGAKIGIGSSAALAVALATALEALGGQQAAQVSGPAHRDFQGGRGSGADIACSENGGVIVFRRGDRSVAKIGWPRDLYYDIYWSGVAADTRDKIERYANIRGKGSRGELAESANQCATAFENGKAASILDALREYCEVLRRFDNEHDLGIFGAGHAAMHDAAARLDAVYKPCGAGGGDVGIAVAASAESLASFAGIATENGFARLDIDIDARGPLLEKNAR